MITFPNAKINLGLNILRRRPDGYHDISTVFYPIPLTDVLEMVPSPDGVTHLHCYGRPLTCSAADNLVLRACDLMQRRYGAPHVDVHLYKHIPDGAGLGGGSSDAAHAMLMLNDMGDLHVPHDELAAQAATLGADCAFFIYNRPMVARGIGTVLSDAPQISLSGLALVVVKPPVSVSTAEAYARVAPGEPATPVEVVTAWPLPMWDGQLVNDFEPSVFALHPELWAIKLMLLEAGAEYAAMSGSGSAIFGIFRRDNLSDIADKLSASGEVYVMHLD